MGCGIPDREEGCVCRLDDLAECVLELCRDTDGVVRPSLAVP